MGKIKELEAEIIRLKQEQRALLLDWAYKNPKALADFDEGTLAGRTLEEYLNEYSYISDILWSVASDMGAPQRILDELLE